MSKIKLDVLGFRFEKPNPAFVETQNGFYYHIRTKRLFEKDSFDARLTVEGKSFKPGELGNPHKEFITEHGGVLAGMLVDHTGGGHPITASVTKAPADTADDTGEVTIAGGPADKAYTITLTVKGEASVGDDVQNVSISQGKTAAEAATLLKNASSDPNVVATVTGAVVTFTPASGKKVATLTVSVA